MGKVDRREFLRQAAYCGAAVLWGTSVGRASGVSWSERRDLFPEGVASGDPAPNSVILWTRRPPLERAASKLTVEIAEHSAFKRVVGKSVTPISAEADWTCRVLVGLSPGSKYGSKRQRGTIDLIFCRATLGKYKPY